MRAASTLGRARWACESISNASTIAPRLPQTSSEALRQDGQRYSVIQSFFTQKAQRTFPFARDSPMRVISPPSSPPARPLVPSFTRAKSPFPIFTTSTTALQTSHPSRRLFSSSASSLQNGDRLPDSDSSGLKGGQARPRKERCAQCPERVNPRATLGDTGSTASSSSSTSSSTRESSKSTAESPDLSSPADPTGSPSDPSSFLSQYPTSLRNLAQNAGYTLRRPTRDELLASATSFLQRLRIRFKWFTIRGFRRFNADDISAFFGLAMLGPVMWILIGTTTFFSVVFATLNSFQLQEWLARKLGDYMTSNTGITVVFESAIVPKWKDSKISFKNVYVSRRPRSQIAIALEEREKTRREARRTATKNGANTAAGWGMAWEGLAQWFDDGDDEPPSSSPPTKEEVEEEDANYTMFDLNIDSVDVTLSLARWLDGKGLVESAVVKGVRGIIDRRHVYWDPDVPWDYRAARTRAQPGDFHLNSLQVEDLLVTVYQPGDFRPFNFSVFSAHVRTLRKQWLCFDMLCADSITGQVDGCLFSLHKPQSIGRTTEADLKDSRWKRMSRIRIDGVNIDHVRPDVTGPLSWITSGKFDVVADVKLPRDPSEEIDINAIISELVDNLSHAVLGGEDESLVDGKPDPNERIPGQHPLARPPIQAPSNAPRPQTVHGALGASTALSAGSPSSSENTMAVPIDTGSDGITQASSTSAANQRKQTLPKETSDIDAAASATTSQSATERERDRDRDLRREQATKEIEASVLAEKEKPTVTVDVEVRFKDIKAAVPLFTRDLTVVDSALVRPIVAFMNANRTLIPIHIRVDLDLKEFDGSLDLAQTGLLNIVSDKIYEALAHHVQSESANSQRLRNVSLWSLRLTANAAHNLVSTMRDNLARSNFAGAEAS